ncbi:YDG domain-containing protein [Rhodoferax sp. U11-2br]|uniref:YDG domain-containing protein n=1 Tax=Rhodoferax sp. U11-2br TaxID=2838878 RepID=UPI001BEBDB23|nr:YDG domain-containing protein [Rhodoferax sp. U11-2br]MBT3065380.1 filamentous hemagglutinin N-terminal domain-containing protein [Rhodoferax sp. U11-2br]
MNRIYRLIWSHVHQTWVIVSERTKGKGKATSRKLIASALLAATHIAMAAPTGGQVTAGSGSVSQSGTTTTVTQSSQNLSLSWSSFNTTSNETVNFIQPSTSSIAVNRISDTSATQFYGQLNANGQVYLINPNGILFGAGSQINVGGLVASTLNISDASLTSATRNFSGTGSGSIINQGTINAANGGYVALIGNTVSNAGTINATAGAVALGAGNDVTLSFSGDSLVKLQVNQSTLNNLAENGGLIKADGGAVWLSAGAKDAVLASVVNNTGIIEARSVQNVNGAIVLEAGSAGSATNSGTLAATGANAGETGGTVKVLGGTVKLAAGSVIDVSGDSGGGTSLVGGNFLGTGTEQNAKKTTVEAGASIKADAITTGNGGNVAVWSDGTTQFNGTITARGGSTSGNGGEVETSGKLLNIKASASVNTAATHGKRGNWLLDPDDITIGDTNIWGNSYAINVDTTVLTNALNNGNVTIKTTGSSASCTGTTCTGTSGNGDIIVLDSIGAINSTTTNWNSSSTLTLSAYRDIHFKYINGNYTGGAIVSSSGGAGNVVLRADNSATGTGTVIFDDSNYNFVILTESASTASIYYNPTSYLTPTNYSNYVLAQQYNAYMAINVTGSAASKIYDGSTTATLSGLASSQTLPNGLTLDTGSAVGFFANKNVGTNKVVTITGVTASGNGAATGSNSDGATVVSYNNNDYYINGLDSKTATITAKTISASGVTANNKTYDGTTTATLSNSGSVAASIIGGDSVSVSSGTATFDNANAGVSKVVTVTGLSLSGTDAGNYILTQPTGLTATINKADLTLSGTKVYDGTTSVAGSTLTATGVAGQTFTVSGSGDASNLSSKNVQSGTTLGSITGLSLGSSNNGGLSSNYNVLSTSGSSYTVTAKGITLTGITAADKTYDATTSATLNTANVAYSGMVNGDDVSLGGSGSGSFATKDVGTNKTVTVSGYSLSGADAGNYVVAQPTGLTASITKANLVVSGVSGVNKTYDATTTATLTGSASVSALQSDVVSVTGTGSGSFADANAGTNKTVTVTGYTLSGADANNYNLVQPTSVTATINKADLSLSGSKVYDGTTSVAGNTLTATGVAGQTFTITGSGDASNLASKNVQNSSTLGSTTGLSLGTSSNGGLSSNYNVLSTAGSSYSVTPKGITLTGITAVDKVYDATTTATLNTANVSYSGMINGDTVALGGSGTGSFATKGVDTNKVVTVSGYTLSGADASNYVVAQPTGLTANITKADLVVSGISGVNKTYDATTTATLSGSASVSALLSDVVSVAGTGTGSFANANADTGKAITVTGYTLTGSDAGNYNVVQPTGVTASINKANLTLSGTKVYDGTTSVAGSTLTATGVAGQTFTVSGAGDASNLASKNVQNNSALGSTTGLSLGASGNGGLSSNYNVLSTSGSNYTVTPKGITLTGITAADKVYDATTTATLNTTNVSYSGMINGDDVSLGGSGTGSFATKGVDTNKVVTVSGYTLSGADASNYVVAQPTGLTATISKADLSLTGLSTSDKVYDTTTTATLSGTASLSAAFGSDVVSLTGTGTGNFADKNVGTHKSVTVSGYTLTGTDAGNYNIVDQNALTANITPASMTVSGITAADKVYDGTTSATVSTSNATLAGRLGSDVITIASTGLFSDAAVGDGKTVNLSSTYGGADAGNYIITGQSLAFASITAVPVVVPSTPAQNTPTQQIQNTVTQVQSTVLPPQASAQPQVLNLSSTLVVQQQTDSGSSSTSTSSSSSNAQATGTVVNTTTGFGTPAPMLQIQNGGLQLPLVLASITE